MRWGRACETEIEDSAPEVIECWLLTVETVLFWGMSWSGDKVVNADSDSERSLLLAPFDVDALRSVVDPNCFATDANCLCVRPKDASRFL
jgi:hypothetical protein